MKKGFTIMIVILLAIISTIWFTIYKLDSFKGFTTSKVLTGNSILESRDTTLLVGEVMDTSAYIRVEIDRMKYDTIENDTASLKSEAYSIEDTLSELPLDTIISDSSYEKTGVVSKGDSKIVTSEKPPLIRMIISNRVSLPESYHLSTLPIGVHNQLVLGDSVFIDLKTSITFEKVEP